MKYICELCGWIYNEEQGAPESGIPAGTAFQKLPDGFVCPDCGSEKEAFDPMKASVAKQPKVAEVVQEPALKTQKPSDR